MPALKNLEIAWGPHYSRMTLRRQGVTVPEGASNSPRIRAET